MRRRVLIRPTSKLIQPLPARHNGGQNVQRSSSSMLIPRCSSISRESVAVRQRPEKTGHALPWKRRCRNAEDSGNRSRGFVGNTHRLHARTVRQNIVPSDAKTTINDVSRRVPALTVTVSARVSDYRIGQSFPSYITSTSNTMSVAPVGRHATAPVWTHTRSERKLKRFMRTACRDR